MHIVLLLVHELFWPPCPLHTECFFYTDSWLAGCSTPYSRMRRSKGFRVPGSRCNAFSHGLQCCSPPTSSIQATGRGHSVNPLEERTFFTRVSHPSTDSKLLLSEFCLGTPQEDSRRASLPATGFCTFVGRFSR